MANLKAHAPGGELVQRIEKPCELAHGVFLAAVGIGKMGKDALRTQAGQRADPGNVRHGGVHGRLVAEKAQPGHARVHLEVDLQRPAPGLGAAGKSQPGLRIPHRLGEIPVQELAGILWRSGAQDQDGRPHPRLPKLYGFIQAGHGQVVAPQLLQLAGHGDRPVAISVGLRHP